MSEKIITRPPTPEYEEAYERVFGKKLEAGSIMKYDSIESFETQDK